ncbi:MAG: hypothetical protein HY852_13025 [Bradyrhizobium sp.]|uniref:hypothetical protein n=1 Tax=Bradyrhizobium sp. TaxID=376 RepID=UPI0025C23D78|nr:hypothetical protein [Bradyrhizobium sp.]MBI5262727.1 hypothetical protein [Bradyrhizobium sp.]
MTTGIAEATPVLHVQRWARVDEAPFAEPVFIFDADGLPEDLSNVSVVMPQGGAARARELARRNAARVILGDAALKDSSIVAPLAKELGEAKVGVWLPVQRMMVSWALDVESNADFRCLAPSRAKPAWEVLTSNGAGSGTDALWWSQQMQERGAAIVLVGADLTGDADLDICAEITEVLGERFWLTPRADAKADMRPWLQYGHVRNLVLPACDQAIIAELIDVITIPGETAAA